MNCYPIIVEDHKMASAASAQEKKIPEQAELTVAVLSRIVKEIPDPLGLVKLLNKNTVIAGGYILAAIEATDNWKSDLDIITTDPTEIEKFLIKAGYLRYWGMPDGSEDNDQATGEDAQYYSAVISKIQSGYSYAPEIKSVHPFTQSGKDVLLRNVDVIIIDKKYENNAADFINECFDLDFCKVYFDGSKVVGYTGQKALKFSPMKFVQRRYPTDREKQLTQMIKILKRVEKYQKRGYNITLE